MKKIFSRLLNLHKFPEDLKKDQLKFKKHSSRIKMMDRTPVGGIEHSLNLHQIPIKIEAPSTSELLDHNFRPTIDSPQKRPRGRPRIDFLERPSNVMGEKKREAKKTGKRRGRPVKYKNFDGKPLVCGLCDFKAKNFYELEGHLKTHSNQNVFECPYCSSTFSQKGNLITHIRTHTKEKPFKCLMCDFAASQKVNLQVHIRVHTKEKPFKCSKCNFSTAQKCNLAAHFARRHSNVEVVKTQEICENEWGSTDTQLKYYRCRMCMFSCRLKRKILEHMKLQHQYSAFEYQTVDLVN